MPMKKHFLLAASFLLLALGAAARPMLFYSNYSDCCYGWVVMESSNGTILAHGNYCDPNCSEGRDTRTAGPGSSLLLLDASHQAALEGKLRQAAKSALPGVAIQEVRYRPAGPRHVVEGIKADDLAQLPAEVAKILATHPGAEALPGKPGACRLKECSLFPNPVREVLTFRFAYDCAATGGSVSKDATITATSLATSKQTVLWTGRLTQENNELAIPVANLGTGLYKVRVQVGVFDQSFDMQKL